MKNTLNLRGVSLFEHNEDGTIQKHSLQEINPTKLATPVKCP